MAQKFHEVLTRSGADKSWFPDNTFLFCFGSDLVGQQMHEGRNSNDLHAKGLSVSQSNKNSNKEDPRVASPFMITQLTTTVGR